MELARRLIACVIACAGLLLLSGCGGDGDGGASAPQGIASITVSAETLTVGTAATQSFSATAKDRAGNAIKDVSFTWASSNAGIASIASDGVVTGIAPGTSNITASAQGVTSAPVAVAVVPATRITGTAAIGAPIKGAQVTLTDHRGVRRTATTGADGLFVINTTGLELPFLIRAEPSGAVSAPLYSASAQSVSDVINITPFTDLIVRSWYAAQSFSIDAAFGDPIRSPAVTVESLQRVHDLVHSAVRRWMDEAGVEDATSFNLISSAFDADGTGIDQVMDRTSVDVRSGTLVITDGTTTQQSTLSYQTSPPSLTLATNVASPSGSNSSTTETLLASEPEEEAAVAGVKALLSEFAQAVGTIGPNTTGEHLVAFIGTDYLNAGIDAEWEASEFVRKFRGYNLSYRLRGVDFIDAAAGLMTASFDRTMSRRNLQGSHTERVQHHFKRYGAEWLFYGDQRTAEVSVLTEARTHQGAITSGSGTMVVARASFNGQFLLRGATVSGGGLWNNAPLLSNLGRYDFTLDSGPLTAPVPAGTPFTITVDFPNRPLASYPLRSNAVTTETISVTNLTSHALANVLGRSLRLEWTLPKSYAIETVKLIETEHLANPDSGFRMSIDKADLLLPPTATDGTLQIAPEPDGSLTVTGIDVKVIVTGVNGERSVAIYSFR